MSCRARWGGQRMFAPRLVETSHNLYTRSVMYGISSLVQRSHQTPRSWYYSVVTMVRKALKGETIEEFVATIVFCRDVQLFAGENFLETTWQSRRSSWKCLTKSFVFRLVTQWGTSPLPSGGKFWRAWGTLERLSRTTRFVTIALWHVTLSLPVQFK